MNGVLSFVWGLLGLGIMIFIHELGHFIAARIVKIEVEVFAIGWGKAIKRWKRGTTEYRINVFPLGGYCRMKGSKDLEKALKDEKNEFGAIEPGSLFSVSPFKRIVTYLCGPLANLLFAIILFIPYFMIGYQAQVDPNRIAITSDYHQLFMNADDYVSPAAKSGVKTGDFILAVDTITTNDFQTLQEVLASRKPSEAAVFTIERSGQTQEISVFPDYDVDQRRPIFGVTSYVEPVVASVEPLSPEAAAGLRSGDTIIGIQQQPVRNTLDLSVALSEDPSEINLSVIHEGNSVPAEVIFHPERGEDGAMILQFSIRRQTTHIPGKPFTTAFASSFKETFALMGQTYVAIPALIIGRYDVNEVLAGPLRISYLIGNMANTGMKSGIINGLRTIVWLLAIVSVSLAAANLLPIPALDGGLILVSIVEFIRRKPVRPRTYARLQNIGALFILLLFIIALIGDVRSFF
ncbi:MAG: RIP metalloprotease RseP [Sphaerochaetaceae bacterium]|jgi:regulator of sigma E protease|nr:RIP metalloprotease RseP [Sphaerochaetaceae bacterium]MDD3670307.1 RIP metalloprotease RseP [Sphaerochaetaceae bacterium]MDD4259395.1 RIP metalloprotease RseP [Sphaerochaetaceae bacterium]MDX9933682.1 RIP metalloprotease RseP [Sphaerochaetaceae bacterium]NLO60270.1 RIP metalloprotease RseP [Spirochaetales bacterium]